MPNIISLSIDDFYQRFGEPEKCKIERLDGAPSTPEAPSYSVWPVTLVVPSNEITDPRIMICDFGESWLCETDTRECLNTPFLYLPPEAIFAKESIGTKADIWTLACTLYEILGKRPLFEGFLPGKDDIAAEMVSTLGLLPQQWWDSWQARGEFFHEDGTWRTDMKRYHDPKSRPLAMRIEVMGRKDDPDFSENEAVSLEKMLRYMLTYEPAKRATAEEVIKSDWMVRWGLPALQKFTESPQGSNHADTPLSAGDLHKTSQEVTHVESTTSLVGGKEVAVQESSHAESPLLDSDIQGTSTSDGKVESPLLDSNTHNTSTNDEKAEGQ